MQNQALRNLTFGIQSFFSPCRSLIGGSAALALLLVVGSGASCERDTKLTIAGENPPKFVMTGSGMLTSVRVRGPQKQREAQGEDKFLYWVIEIKDGNHPRSVEKLSPVIYGKIPEGFEQVYPEHGAAPPLVEDERYYVRVVASEANGDGKYFIIRNGKVEVSDY